MTLSTIQKLLLGLVTLICLAQAVSAATLYVAASDSSATSKAGADFVCDGVNDQVEINAALKALPAEGGTVILSEGTFECTGVRYRTDGDIILPAHTTLKGQGEGITTIRYTESKCYPYGLQFWGCIRAGQQYTTLEDFSLTGWGWIYVYESHVRVNNVTVSTNEAPTHTIQGAYHVRADGKVVEDVEFNNCKAIDCHGFGFLNDADETMSPRLIRNIRYIDCQAIDCGRYERYSDWDVGFDIVENNDIENAQLIRCLAEGSWESGFHLEGSNAFTAKDVYFKDCISRNNAQKGINLCRWGAGYTTPWHAVLENCTSENNRWGFNIDGDPYRPGVEMGYINCVDTGSVIGFRSQSGTGATYSDCVSLNAKQYGFQFISSSKNCVLENCRVDNAKGDGTYLNYRDSTTTNCQIAITAYGGNSPQIINTGGTGNTYDLTWADDPFVISPTPTPTPTPQPTPEPGMPDLVITAISHTPAAPGIGEEVTLTATVENEGTAATPAGVILGVLFRIDEGTDTYKGVWSDDFTGALEPGESVTLSANGGSAGSTWTVAEGDHAVSAVVDDINRIEESNEDNNVYGTVLHFEAEPTPVPTEPPVAEIIPLPDSTAAPTDPDGDGLCEDINGNGRCDFDDVVRFYRNLEWIGANEPVKMFDFNNNLRMDFDDVVMLNGLV